MSDLPARKGFDSLPQHLDTAPGNPNNSGVALRAREGNQPMSQQRHFVRPDI
jgi:hypothetical protein